MIFREYRIALDDVGSFDAEKNALRVERDRLRTAINRHCDRTLAANREPTPADIELWELVKEGA